MKNMEIANTIMQQLGGRRFVLFTGAKNMLAIDNGLRFTIGKNISKANRVEITLNGLDMYDMRFYKYSPAHMKVNHKAMTAEWVDEKVVEVRKFADIFCDQLQELFTETTGLTPTFNQRISCKPKKRPCRRVSLHGR